MKLQARWLVPLLVSVTAVVVLDPSVVLGATVKGKVINTHKLLNPVWTEAAGLAKEEKTHRFTFREPVSTVPLEARQLTGHFSKELCLVALTDANAAPKSKPLRLVIEGGRTSLVTLVVASGQEIRFENHDPTPHAIYEVTGQHGLTKATMEPEAVRSWTPPGPGKYELRDELSPSLRSWIVVEPRAAEVFFPNKGEFAINLEPGKYTLQAYYSGDPVGTAMPFEVLLKPEEQPLKDPLKAGEDRPEDKKDEKKEDDKKTPPGGKPGTPTTPPKGGG